MPVSVIALALLPVFAPPSESELRESYKRSETISREISSRVFNLRVEPNWLKNGKFMWFVDRKDKDRRVYQMVDTATGKVAPAFDHTKLAQALGKEAKPENLMLGQLEFGAGQKTMSFDFANKRYECDLESYEVKEIAKKAESKGRPEDPWMQDTWQAERGVSTSPDGKWTARIKGENVIVGPKGGEGTQATQSGTSEHYFSRLVWSPDSKHLLAVRVTPGDRKPVYLIQSSPKEGGRAKLQTRLYDLPGDKVDNFDIYVIDPSNPKETKLDAETLDYGDLPNFRWKDGNRFTYEKMDRGYGRWRIIEGDTSTAKSKAIVDDDPATFVDSTNQYTRYVENSEEVIFRSERDGWGHLYLADGKGNISNQITKGNWVVRGVDFVDDAKREITFTASGKNAGEDPYFIHYYRIKFDGSDLVELTPGAGNHTVSFSPDRKVLLDTYSQPDVPPVHVVRSATDGHELTKIADVNLSGLKQLGWKAPQPFVAKGRDGKTDIWGLVYRPLKFNPRKKYAVVEDIYAGPQDSFVPKSFMGGLYLQGMAELGFVVVKIDGMGTRNRSKAFHDVCYKNLADAGFPDRILWMQALAKTDKSIDLTRVGIYGTSAGGQNAGGAVLFHPEFYKVAVASCGCHDNRMDKVWWNEQWMGYPVGPHYSASSNIDNAYRLKGKLLLMVGELDHNVPPESTYRYADALERAGKEFELVVLPNQDHTAGGVFGDRKRKDFFVKNLLGISPPDWNK